MKLTYYKKFLLTLIFTLVTPSYADTELIGGEVNFHGVVVALPCSVGPGGDKLMIDFGKVSIKTLYSAQKTVAVPFSIPLENCSTGTYKTVSITFSGIESGELPNHIAISPAAPATTSGVAVALENEKGNLIELNKETVVTAISEGAMSLNFQAAIVGEPTAIDQKTIEPGEFTAIAYYILSYQ
nr:fimbrial protein [Tatumella saanichensis]